MQHTMRKITTKYLEGEGRILQFNATKKFGPDHELNFAIYKISLVKNCSLSSKLLPLVVAMWEEKGDKYLVDFYSFDNNGICLSHGYSRKDGDGFFVDEAHDTDISRLKEHGKTLAEMLEVGHFSGMNMHTTVIDLMNNNLKQSS